MQVLVNVLLLLSASCAAAVSIRGETYVNDQLTPVGWSAILISTVALILGITKELLAHSDTTRKEADAREKEQLDAARINELRLQLSETRTNLESARDERNVLRALLDSTHAGVKTITPENLYVPGGDPGFAGDHYAVLKGDGAQLTVGGGETIAYSFYLSDNPNMFSEMPSAHMTFGRRWTYRLGSAGSILTPPSDAPVPVYVHVSGDRSSWDLVMTVSRTNGSRQPTPNKAAEY